MKKTQTDRDSDGVAREAKQQRSARQSREKEVAYPGRIATLWKSVSAPIRSSACGTKIVAAH